MSTLVPMPITPDSNVPDILRRAAAAVDASATLAPVAAPLATLLRWKADNGAPSEQWELIDVARAVLASETGWTPTGVDPYGPAGATWLSM